MEQLDILTSPVGEIQFLAIKRKVRKTIKKDSPEGYVVRLRFTTKTAEGKKWKETIKAINSDLIGTKHVDAEDQYTLKAFSQYEVTVLDAEGNEYEEKPSFFKEGKGTAQMVVQPDMRNEMGGAIYLVAIIIHELEEGENSGGGAEARELIIEKIKAQMTVKK